jgi:DNA-binding XRE family transcriptional regulator
MVTLEELRLNAGHSPESLAKELGVSNVTIRTAERTGRRPQPQTAKKIADFFGKTVTEIWPVAERKVA